MAVFYKRSTAMRLLALILLCAIHAPALADNVATCILDTVPKTNNDVAAGFAIKACFEAHPASWKAVERGSGRGFFGYASGKECLAKKGSSTPSYKAGEAIYVACKCLYDPPAPGQVTCP